MPVLPATSLSHSCLVHIHQRYQLQLPFVMRSLQDRQKTFWQNTNIHEAMIRRFAAVSVADVHT